MKDRIFEYFAGTFNRTQLAKILVCDDYSEKILVSHNIMKYDIMGEEGKVLLNEDFSAKYNIIACEKISSLINVKIAYDVVYVFHKLSMIDVVNKNEHRSNVYINYFLRDYDNTSGKEFLHNWTLNHIMLNQFVIIGNIIVIEEGMSIKDIMSVIDLPFMIYYEDKSEIPDIRHSDTRNTLTIIRRENHILPTLRFKYRLIDYVIELLDTEDIRNIIFAPFANNLLREIWFESILEAQEKLKQNFLQFKESNDLANLESCNISFRELDKSTMSSITKSVRKYNEAKKGYKLLFNLVAKCIALCNNLFEREFSSINYNKRWTEIYTDLKPIIFYMKDNEINSRTEFYKLFHLMNYHGRKWWKLASKLTKTHNLVFDTNKFPAERINLSLEKNISFQIKGVQNTQFPNSIKSYTFPRFNIQNPIKVVYIEGNLCSHDVTDKDVYYIGKINK
jgi:hypothetical protein